jgi:drug/metabolite transporter (DMT)-like permease
MATTEWTLLLTLSFLWGGSFFFFKVLVDELPPFTVVLGRVGIAAVALNLFLLARRDPMPGSIRTWSAFTVMGVLNNVVPFTLIVFGEMRISSGLASILNATTPVFGVLAAHALTANEKLTWSRGAGVLFGFAGVAILIGPDALAGLGHADLIGEAACLLAALIYGFAGIYGRRFKGISPIKVATGQITASTLVLLPIVALVDRPWTLPMPSSAAWAAFAGIALLSTALAYILYFRILAAAGATNLLLVTFLLPISALLLGWLFLGEHVAPTALIGRSVRSRAAVERAGRISPVQTAACPLKAAPELDADLMIGKKVAAAGIDRRPVRLPHHRSDPFCSGIPGIDGKGRGRRQPGDRQIRRRCQQSERLKVELHRWLDRCRCNRRRSQGSIPWTMLGWLGVGGMNR